MISKERKEELLKNNWSGNDGFEMNDFESREEWYNRIFRKRKTEGVSW